MFSFRKSFCCYVDVDLEKKTCPHMRWFRMCLPCNKNSIKYLNGWWKVRREYSFNHILWFLGKFLLAFHVGVLRRCLHDIFFDVIVSDSFQVNKSELLKYRRINCILENFHLEKYSTTSTSTSTSDSISILFFVVSIARMFNVHHSKHEFKRKLVESVTATQSFLSLT